MHTYIVNDIYVHMLGDYTIQYLLLLISFSFIRVPRTTSSLPVVTFSLELSATPSHTLVLLLLIARVLVV